jgi:hypothetical protein
MDVWILGDTILRWDGQTWNSVPDSVNDNRTASTFWGSGRDNVWASGWGYLGRYDGTGWNQHDACHFGIAIWGIGTSDLWLIQGVAPDTSPYFITHGGASSWPGCWGDTTGTHFTFAHPLQAIWGSGASNVWAVGARGAIIHYDGTAWSQVTKSPATLTLHGVWGTAANDIWAVGDSGVIVHFDGSGWSKGVTLTTRTLHAVWGDPSGDVWAVGDTGTVLHLTR